MPQRNTGQRNYSRRARGTSRYANNRNYNRVSRTRLINNSITIDLISRLTTPQITNNYNSIVNDFFNGASFTEDNFESSILPVGFLGSYFL